MSAVLDLRYLRFALLAFALAVSGCAGHRPDMLLARTIATVPDSAIAARHEIFVATTRAPAKEPRAAFSGRRAVETSFARVDMSVPASHEPGRIERPRSPDAADPARYFTASRIAGYRDGEIFSEALGDHLARNQGRVLVFVHGYNTGFDGAIYRMTQIVHDSGYSGTPVLFSWPSAGRTLDYIYDSNSATASRDALERTLRLIADAGAEHIDIVAHSMGTWPTMEALRQLSITGMRDIDERLGDVVLASPDIDVDVFKSQMRRYGKPDKPFFVMTSRNDRALNVSGLIAGNRPRVGDYQDAEDLAALGVIVVDLSSISSTDRLGHTRFAENPVLVRMLGDRLEEDDGLGASDDAITTRLDGLARGLGQTIGTAAEIIITTPFEVLNVAVGN